MPLGSSKWKWAWRAHFLSHTYETQKICCFLADVKIILLSFFDLSYYLKVAKNAEAFLSRCSELFGLAYLLLNWCKLFICWVNLSMFGNNMSIVTRIWPSHHRGRLHVAGCIWLHARHVSPKHVLLIFLHHPKFLFSSSPKIFLGQRPIFIGKVNFKRASSNSS